MNFGIVLCWLYLVLFAIIPGYAQIATGVFYWYDWGGYPTSLVLGATLLVAIAVVLIDTSYLIFLRRNFNQRARRSAVSNRPPLLFQSARLSPLYYPLSIFAYAWSSVVIALIGLSTFFGTRLAFGRSVNSMLDLSSAGLLLTANSGLLIALAAYSLNAALSNEVKKSLYFYLNCTAILAFNAIINFPTRLSRFALFGALLMMLVVYCVRRKNARHVRSMTYILSLAFPTLVYFLFRFVGVFSRWGDFNFSEGIRAALNINSTLRHADFSDLQMSIIVVRYTLEQGYTLGRQLLSAVFFFIPRRYWENKADPTNFVIGENEGWAFINVSSPIYMEGYIDFAFIGLAAYAIALGYMLAKADYAFTFSNRDPRYMILVPLVAYLPIILRGSLLAVIGIIASVAFFIFLLTYMGRFVGRLRV